MLKDELIKKLYDDYSEKFKGQEIVLGEGNINAKLLLIGEAPGKDEVKLLKPFVGVAGKNLSEFLDVLKIGREEIYITNAIKYRLSETNAKTGRIVNRPALKEEIEQSRATLLEEIKIIAPSYIVTLGNVPLKAVTSNNNLNIGNVHGKQLNVNLLGIEYTVFPLYHPASIIYNRNLKEVYLEDIDRLKELL
jgi:uracil-DNA glycosylase